MSWLYSKDVMAAKSRDGPGTEGHRKPLSYAAYLLRLWQATSGGTAPWRASLQDPHTGQRVGFACLADLFAFLEDQTRLPGPGLERPDEDGSQPPAAPD